jgi:glycerol transport system substrate-binding protein
MRQFRRRKGPLIKISFLTVSSAAAIIAAAFATSAPVRAADDATIQKWIAEFQPSTLSKDDQKKELEWFAKAAEPFKGMEINVVSETITTHEYESQTLAKAFTELTGIKLSTTSSRKVTSSRSCRPRCSRARTSMTAGSTTPT